MFVWIFFENGGLKYVMLRLLFCLGFSLCSFLGVYSNSYPLFWRACWYGMDACLKISSFEEFVESLLFTDWGIFFKIYMNIHMNILLNIKDELDKHLITVHMNIQLNVQINNDMNIQLIIHMHILMIINKIIHMTICLNTHMKFSYEYSYASQPTHHHPPSEIVVELQLSYNFNCQL